MPCWTHRVASISRKLLRVTSRVYHRALEDHPVATQSLQTGVLCGVSDLLAQCVVERHKYHLTRTLEFALVGTIFTGPLLTFWYRLLQRRYPDRSNKSTLLKVAIDQLAFTPPFNFLFIIVLGFVQQDEWQKTVDNLQDNYVDILVMNYYIWPATQYANFRWVPLRYQVLFEQSFSLIWSTYISWKTHCGWDEDKPGGESLLHPKCSHMHKKSKE